MGLVKSIRKIGQKVGSVLRKAAPIVGLIPGVGLPAGAALGALGSIAEGGRGLGGTLSSAAMGGLSGLGGSALRSLLAAKKASAVAGSMGKLGGIIGNSTPGGTAAAGGLTTGGSGGILGRLGSILGGEGGVTGVLGNLGGLVKDNQGLILGGLGAYQSSKNAGKAEEYRKKAIQAATAQYEAAAPLRAMGLAGLTDPRMVPVSQIFNQPRPTFRRLT